MVGDGALGFWKALRVVFPDIREQRCWFHISSNVLAALPKSAYPAALAEIYSAEDRDHALKAVKAFEADYGATQGGRENHRAHRRAVAVLRLPRRALDPPACY
jgi:putative transposase